MTAKKRPQRGRGRGTGAASAMGAALQLSAVPGPFCQVGGLAGARRLLERVLALDPSDRPARENLEYVERELSTDGAPSGAGR